MEADPERKENQEETPSAVPPQETEAVVVVGKEENTSCVSSNEPQPEKKDSVNQEETSSAVPLQVKEAVVVEKKEENTSSVSADEPEKKDSEEDDPYSLKVKESFILKDRAKSLPPLRLETVVEPEKNQGKKSKKKRPRDDRITDGMKLCQAIIRGDECPFGDKCRFSHDMKAYLAVRPPDIPLEGGCPGYRLTGYCPFGAMCRLGGSHINMATGENLKKNPLPENPPSPILNVLSKDISIQLRQRKYKFKTKAHFEVRNDDKKKPEESTTKQESTPPSMSPLPSTRKLIDFSNKVYVAPLTTVGNLPFRRIMKKFGADITCGEMALSANLIQGQPSEWALLKRHPDEDIFGVQIAAGYPDQFARVAEVIEAEMDAVDFVDLNLGCPLDLVCNKGAGASLMSRDKQLKGSLQSITKILSCPVTIKMRTGWDINKPFAHDLVRKIQSWKIDGIGALMVHGRSRLQRYGKLADWDYIKKVCTSQADDLPRIPLIGNGDIFSYTDYEEKVLARPDLTTCAMLGRGALIKPWLPTEIKEKRHWDISSSERLDLLKDFVKFGLEHWGSDQQGVNNCRRFLLEWLSFLHRYVPVGLLEVIPQQMNKRPPTYMCGRDDLETLMLSPHSSDWIHISEMILGPVPDGFQFEPKHKAKGYANS